MNKASFTAEEQQYWIQEQAPSGNWVNKIGFQSGTPFDFARKQMRSWRKSFSNRQVRLASVITKGILE